MKRLPLYIVVATLGVIFGYLLYILAANQETFQFYTVRKWITGKENMSEIADDPLDRVFKVLVFPLFALVGAVAAILIAVAMRRHQNIPGDK